MAGWAMTREGVLAVCAGLPGAAETFPFGDGVAVYKVGGRIFALCALDGDPGEVSLKCDPALAAALRERHPAVRPGYHLNKRHWVTVRLDGSVPDDELAGWIEDSWELVVARLPRRVRAELTAPGGTPPPPGE